MRGCLCLFTCTGMMMDIVAKLESHSSFLPVCLLSPCIHLKLSTSSQVRPSPAQHKPETISVKAKINCCADLNIHIYKYIQTYMRTFYKPRMNKFKKSQAYHVRLHILYGKRKKMPQATMGKHLTYSYVLKWVPHIYREREKCT